MDLGSLLGALGQDPQEQGQGDSAQDPMASMLGALLGGMEQGGAPNQDAPALGGDEVLGSLGSARSAPMLGDAPASGGMPAGGDLGGLLGALMGGGGQGAQGGDAMMGMLGGLLGGMGGAAPNAGAPGGMNTGMNAALAPLADMLADKLGIPREMAMAAMAIVVPMILGKLSGSGTDASGQGGGLSFSRDEQEQMIGSLTQQTGMSSEQAAQTLNQAVQVLGGQ